MEGGPMRREIDRVDLAVMHSLGESPGVRLCVTTRYTTGEDSWVEATLDGARCCELAYALLAHAAILEGVEGAGRSSEAVTAIKEAADHIGAGLVAQARALLHGGDHDTPGRVLPFDVLGGDDTTKAE